MKFVSRSAEHSGAEDRGRPGAPRHPAYARHTDGVAARSSVGTGSPAVDSRRSELLRIAGEVFSNAGYSGTSLRDVADAAGILTGSLYHHFPSKESLAVELISEFYADLRALVRRPELAASDPVAAIAEFAQKVAAVAARHRAAVHMCRHDAPTNATEALSSLVKQNPPGMDRRWATLVAAARDAGAIRGEVDLPMLRATLRTGVLNLAVLPGVEALGELVGALTSLLFHGLATEAPAFAELDASVPSRTAQQEIDTWTVPADPQGKSSRHRILATARDEFARRGYDATTIRDIAAAAGMRPSSLYRHFASKQEILDAIMDRFSHSLLTGYEAVAASPGSAMERLDAILRLMAWAARLFGREFSIVRALDVTAAGSPLFHSAARLRVLSDVVSDGIDSRQFAAPPDAALLTLALRSTLWIPLGDGTSSASRRHGFLRECLLAGASRG